MRVLAIAAICVSHAHAQPATEAALVWQAPGSCPDAGEVRARIERRLGSSIERAVRGIEVDVAPDGDGGERRFVARIDLRAVTMANEVRVLTSARCDDLADAVAVVIARVAAEIRERPAELAAAPVLPAPRRVAPRTWGGGLRAIGVSGVGALPGIGLGGELAVYARRRTLFAELAHARWFPGSRTLYDGGRGRVDVSLAVTALRFGWGPEHLPLRAWLSGELGTIDGRGVGVENALAGSAQWLGLGAGFGVAWPMTPRTRLIGVVEAVLPLQRARFGLRHGSEVYRPDMATARYGLGLEVGWR